MKVSALAGGLFVYLLACLVWRYLLPDELSARNGAHLFDRLPSGWGGQNDLLRWIVLGFGIPLLLWICGVFDRR